jgi:dolichol-phosphate mannosyltransferase
VSGIPTITIVTPIFNEEASLGHFIERVAHALLGREDARYVVLFVDDGSTDNSWRIIDAICQQSDRFKGVRLSRNFGAHVAITAGIDHAEGDAIATLACDLQDPPEVLIEFVDRWRSGAEVVWGARRSRSDSMLRRAVSDFFGYLLRRFALPSGSRFVTGSFLLVDRRVAECFRRFREHNRITFALVAWSGFDQQVVHYDRGLRVAGSSSWTLSRLMKTGYDAFIGFSALPAKLMTVMGAVVFLLSLLSIAYLIITYLVSNVLPGWTGLMVTMTLFFGLLFMMVGMVAEYLHRIFLESTQRPLYFVSRSVGLARGARHE